MIYRQAEADDLYQLVELRWEFQVRSGEPVRLSKEEFVDYCEKFLANGLADGSWVCWVAAEDDAIVSCACIHRIRKIPRPNRRIDEYGYLTEVFTKPEFRKQGIGGQLLAAVRQWAEEEGLNLLAVRPDQESVPFYQHRGFLEDHRVMQIVLRED